MEAAAPFSLTSALESESIINSTLISSASHKASVSPAFESDPSALAEIMGASKQPEKRETRVRKPTNRWLPFEKILCVCMCASHGLLQRTSVIRPPSVSLREVFKREAANSTSTLAATVVKPPTQPTSHRVRCVRVYHRE